jgi:integration host factor subunit alpha
MPKAKNMKKADLAAAVATSGIGAKESADIVNRYFEAIEEGLLRDREVKIMGLGTFILKHTAARAGRNPKTGKPAVIEARNSILFHPAKNVKAALN